MRKELTIYSCYANISSENSKELKVELSEIHLGFINQFTEDEIVSNCDNDVALFRRLLENEDVQADLHEYLKDQGIIYNKG